MVFAASAAIRAAARTPSISFPVRRMPDGTRVSDLPVGASRCAALPPRARPGNIALAESNNDRLGLRLTPPPRPRSLPDRALLTAEASAFLQSVAGAGSGGGEAGKSFTMSRPRPPPIPFPRPGPPRRALSEEEMEAVMLGGATD